MYQNLSDLRIVKLALAIEDSFEGYEAGLLDLIDDESIHRRLAPLFHGGPAHNRLRELHDHLEDTSHEEVSTEEVLQVILECERSARDLYQRYLDHVNDPRVEEILRGLVVEEEEHARIVEQAILAFNRQMN